MAIRKWQNNLSLKSFRVHITKTLVARNSDGKNSPLENLTLAM